MAPPKGKQPTKGNKEILEANKATLLFYSKIMASATILYTIICIFIFSAGLFTYLALTFATAIYAACYTSMKTMSTATYSESGALIDGGIDLNMTSGMAEHIKDVILLTVIVQTLGIFSHYFWVFWLLAPMRLFYMLWTYILAPWIFAPAPEDNMDPKAQKKLDRKMKRGGMM